EPDGPMTDTKEPLRTSRSTPASTRSTTSPRRYSLTRPRAATAHAPSIVSSALTGSLPSRPRHGSQGADASTVPFRCRRPDSLLRAPETCHGPPKPSHRTARRRPRNRQGHLKDGRTAPPCANERRRERVVVWWPVQVEPAPRPGTSIR